MAFEPNTPWPDKDDAAKRFQLSEKTGHTQLLLKCTNCGLEFIILTWRTSNEMASAFGIYDELLHGLANVHLDGGKTVEIPCTRVPAASEITCPECRTMGKVCLTNYRRMKGPIFRLGF